MPSSTKPLIVSGIIPRHEDHARRQHLVRANTRALGPARELLTLIGSQGAHTIVLSRHILSEVKRTLLYPRLQAQYGLTEPEIQEHVDLLQRVATIVEPFISEPVVAHGPANGPLPFAFCGNPSFLSLTAISQNAKLFPCV